MPYMSTSSDTSHTSLVGVAPTDDIFDLNHAEMDVDVEHGGEELEPAYSPAVREI